MIIGIIWQDWSAHAPLTWFRSRISGCACHWALLWRLEKNCGYASLVLWCISDASWESDSSDCQPQVCPIEKGTGTKLWGGFEKVQRLLWLYPMLLRGPCGTNPGFLQVSPAPSTLTLCALLQCFEAMNLKSKKLHLVVFSTESGRRDDRWAWKKTCGLNSATSYIWSWSPFGGC